MISLKQQWLSHVQRFSLAVLLAAYLPVFTGLALNWLAFPYDESRALQIMAMTLMSLVAVASVCFRQDAHEAPFAFELESRRGLVVLGALLVPGLLLTLAGCPVPSYSLSDAGLILMMAASGIGVYMAMRANPGFAAGLTAVMALAPAISIAMLLRTTVQSLGGGAADDWQPNFANMRIYDSTALLSLFLLWLRPSWLARPALTAPVTILAALYVMSLLVDGGRASLLAMVAGLAGAALLYRDRLPQWKVPALSVVLGGALFGILQLLIHGQKSALVTSNALMRSDTSGRWELWVKAWHLWLQHPATGIGGGIFGAVKPPSIPMHPHDFPLQMLAEWGLTGLFVLVIFGVLIRQVVVNRDRIPAMLTAGVIALAVDSLFSGNLIYPTTQILCLWLAMLALSLAPARETRPLSYNWQLTTKVVVLLIAVAGSGAIWVQHAKDLSCIGCVSHDDVGAPRFWHFGRAIHLSTDLTRIQP